MKAGVFLYHGGDHNRFRKEWGLPAGILAISLAPALSYKNTKKNN